MDEILQPSTLEKVFQLLNDVRPGTNKTIKLPVMNGREIGEYGYSIEILQYRLPVDATVRMSDGYLTIIVPELQTNS